MKSSDVTLAMADHAQEIYPELLGTPPALTTRGLLFHYKNNTNASDIAYGIAKHYKDRSKAQPDNLTPTI